VLKQLGFKILLALVIWAVLIAAAASLGLL
jgi:hypothetical protein